MGFLSKIKSYTDTLRAEGHINGNDLFVLFLTAFISANFYTAALGDFDALTYVRDISQLSFWLVFFAVSAIMAIILVATRKALILNWSFLISSVMFSVLLCTHVSEEIYFNIGVAFVLIFILKYVTAENRLGLDFISMSERVSFYITAGIFVLFTILVSYWTVYKYFTFSNATFDFGIFCQMFEQMAKTGMPFTTIERGEYLSHFAVHFSPVFYFLLPGYMIFRSPVYLLVMQAFVVGMGMFPLRRICLKLGMSPAMSAAAAALYAFFPTMANGCFYDFHENKFLSVFILYMIYFALCEKNIGTFIFAFATLTVKEDAAIYVMAITVWMFLTKRKRINSVIIFLLSVIYFVFACSMIQLSGGEIMMSRLDNYYMDPNGGFIDVIKTCFYDIGFLIKEVFLGANTEAFSEITYGGQKIEFIFWLCIPLLFMPFASKHTTHLALLIPLLVINLMPEWMYQYNVNYQYTYGTAAILIASAIITIAEKNKDAQKKLLCCALVLCIVFASSLVSPKASRYVNRYNKNAEVYEQTEAALDTIPHDASVTSYGFFTPHISYIDDLHSSPNYYTDYEQTDYYVIDTRYMEDSHTVKMIDAMEDNYELVAEGGYAQVYKRID